MEVGLCGNMFPQRYVFLLIKKKNKKKKTCGGKTNVVGFILKLSDILEGFRPHLDKSGRTLVAQMFQSCPAFLLHVLAMCQNVRPTMPFRLGGGSPGTEADL